MEEGAMQRRRFFKTLFGWAASLPAVIQAKGHAVTRPAQPLLNTRLAGFQYYAGDRVWDGLRENNELTLRREPANRHDPRAVEVYWHEHKLGYVPRVDNAAIAQLLERNAPLQANITRLEVVDNPWRRIHFQINLAV
jgi:hypothetical protein